MTAQALEQSVLESKDKDQLLAIAKALGLKASARNKKAEIIDQILTTTGSESSGDGGDDGGCPSGTSSPSRTAASTTVRAVSRHVVALGVGQPAQRPGERRDRRRDATRSSTRIRPPTGSSRSATSTTRRRERRHLVRGTAESINGDESPVGRRALARDPVGR